MDVQDNTDVQEKKNGTNIAKKIALLLRYGSEKPVELEACPEGYYSLLELHEFWGVPQAISFDEMLTILREHQYKQHDVSRWELDPPDDPTRIRVVKKMRKGGRGSKGTRYGARKGGCPDDWNTGKARNSGWEGRWGDDKRNGHQYGSSGYSNWWSSNKWDSQSEWSRGGNGYSGGESGDRNKSARCGKKPRDMREETETRESGNREINASCGERPSGTPEDTETREIGNREKNARRGERPSVTPEETETQESGNREKNAWYGEAPSDMPVDTETGESDDREKNAWCGERPSDMLEETELGESDDRGQSAWYDEAPFDVPEETEIGECDDRGQSAWYDETPSGVPEETEAGESGDQEKNAWYGETPSGVPEETEIGEIDDQGQSAWYGETPSGMPEETEIRENVDPGNTSWYGATPSSTRQETEIGENDDRGNTVWYGATPSSTHQETEIGEHDDRGNTVWYGATPSSTHQETEGGGEESGQLSAQGAHPHSDTILTTPLNNPFPLLLDSSTRKRSNGASYVPGKHARRHMADVTPWGKTICTDSATTPWSEEHGISTFGYSSSARYPCWEESTDDVIDLVTEWDPSDGDSLTPEALQVLDLPEAKPKATLQLAPELRAGLCSMKGKGKRRAEYQNAAKFAGA